MFGGSRRSASDTFTAPGGPDVRGAVPRGPGRCGAAPDRRGRTAYVTGVDAIAGGRDRWGRCRFVAGSPDGPGWFVVSSIGALWRWWW